MDRPSGLYFYDEPAIAESGSSPRSRSPNFYGIHLRWYSDGLITKRVSQRLTLPANVGAILAPISD